MRRILIAILLLSPLSALAGDWLVPTSLLLLRRANVPLAVSAAVYHAVTPKGDLSTGGLQVYEDQMDKIIRSMVRPAGESTVRALHRTAAEMKEISEKISELKVLLDRRGLKPQEAIFLRHQTQEMTNAYGRFLWHLAEHKPNPVEKWRFMLYSEPMESLGLASIGAFTSLGHFATAAKLLAVYGVYKYVEGKFTGDKRQYIPVYGNYKRASALAAEIQDQANFPSQQRLGSKILKNHGVNEAEARAAVEISCAQGLAILSN